MENRHHYKYVIIDSSKENNNNVDAKFKVQIPQGITGTTRVCVKSFSMPNSYHNIYGDLKTAKFVEFYRPTSDGAWVYEVFSFNLAEGYTETDNLFSELQSKFTNASGNEITRESDGTTTVQHVGQTDTPTTISVSHDSSTYLNSLSFDSGTQDKVIGLYVDDQNKHTIWESLGFDKRRIIKSTDLADIQAQLNTLAPGASPLDIQGIIPPSLLHMRGCKSSGSVEYRTVVSPHAGTHENHNGIYVASQALGNDTMVARSVDDTTMVAHSSDVLQFINNDVPRFSHLTYHTEVPMWNVLTKNYLNNFDIEIRDHKGHLFPRSAIADFVMVLMFEVVDEINENIDDVVAYQTQAYREGHPTSSGNIFS